MSFSIVRAVNVYEQRVRFEWGEDGSRTIGAPMRYRLVSCAHRVTMDVFEDPAKRDPVNAFVQLLYDRGSAVERERIVRHDLPFVDLPAFNTTEKARKTAEAMAAGATLIYNCRIAADDLLFRFLDGVGRLREQICLGHSEKAVI